MLASYNIMNQMVTTGHLWMAIALTLTCVSCGQSGDAIAEAPRSSTPQGTQTQPAPASAPRIVFLGDSLTAGYGLAKEQSVPSLIESHLHTEGYPYEVVNAGVSGDTSAGGLSRLDWSLDGDVR